MRLSPLSFILTACAATYGIGQALVPTAHAQPAKPVMRLPAEYQVSVKSLHVKHMAGGLEVTGQVVNTGRQTLTYTSVVIVFTNAAGQEIARDTGYLTAGPVRPGQTAEFRACSPEAPEFSHITLLLSEAGHTVLVEAQKRILAEGHASDSHRTTVW